MSIGGNRSPYRPPCGYDADAPEFYWLGPPWQHYRAGDAAVTRRVNTTLIPNWADPATPPTVPPPQPYWLNTAYSECGGDGQQPCGPPDETFIAANPNTYSASGTVNLATCRKLGFKYVVARKAWHGAFPFGGAGDDSSCCSGSHPAVLSSPPLTKYRTLTVTCASSAWVPAGLGPPAGGTTSQSGSWTSTVGRYTGNITNSANGGFTEYDGTHPASAEFFTGYGLANLSYCKGVWSGGDLDGGDDLGTLIVADLNAGNLDGGTNSSGYSITVNTASATELSLTCTQNGGYSAGGDDSNETFTVDIVLSDAYTSGDVNDDVDTLLDAWDLSNDQQIPFRVDLNCTSGPLVSYMESGAAGPQGFTIPGSGITYDSSTGAASWSATIGAYTGDVLGAPLTPGSDPYFDFRFQVYAPTDCGGGGSGYDIVGWGAYAPSWAPNATQWTNLADASALPPGAFAAYNSLATTISLCAGGGGYGGGYLIKSKYAEVVLLGAPSHNFARPCGPKDAETIDQTSITCSDGTGTLRWPDAPNPCSPGEWNDNMPKGDWCLLTWTFDFRDDYSTLRPVTGAWNGITCEQQCSKFVPCCPAVIYISNNGESSTNSQTFTMPALDCDECYGSLWQQTVMQWMTDPLWQPPKPPCNLTDPSNPDYVAGLVWLEDDGSGKTDGSPNSNDYYYPQRPYEEARCPLPTGAPALPSGCFIGALDVDIINFEGSFARAAAFGNVIQPPTAGACWMPVWTWATNRYNTVTSSGRWSCDYADPMAVCEDDIEIEPP